MIYIIFLTSYVWDTFYAEIGDWRVLAMFAQGSGDSGANMATVFGDASISRLK